MSAHSCDTISGERILVCCSVKDQCHIYRSILSEIGIYHAFDLFPLGAAPRTTQLCAAGRILREVHVSVLRWVAPEVWVPNKGVWRLGMGSLPEHGETTVYKYIG